MSFANLINLSKVANLGYSCTSSDLSLGWCPPDLMKARCQKLSDRVEGHNFVSVNYMLILSGRKTAPWRRTHGWGSELLNQIYTSS